MALLLSFIEVSGLLLEVREGVTRPIKLRQDILETLTEIQSCIEGVDASYLQHVLKQVWDKVDDNFLHVQIICLATVLRSTIPNVPADILLMSCISLYSRALFSYASATSFNQDDHDYSWENSTRNKEIDIRRSVAVSSTASSQCLSSIRSKVLISMIAGFFIDSLVSLHPVLHKNYQHQCEC